NQPFNTAGMSYAQIVGVGSVNTGGPAISAGSPLYPPPYTIPIGTTQVPAAGNQPGNLGAFFNQSAYGFVVGSGTGATLTSAVLVGANTNVLYWRAGLSDMGWY